MSADDQNATRIEGGLPATAKCLIVESLAAELPDDARDILQQIGSFGMTAFSRDDQIEFHAVLTVESRETD